MKLHYLGGGFFPLKISRVQKSIILYLLFILLIYGKSDKNRIGDQTEKRLRRGNITWRKEKVRRKRKKTKNQTWKKKKPYVQNKTEKRKTWRGEKVRRKVKGNWTWTETKNHTCKIRPWRKNKTRMDAAPGLSWNSGDKKREFRNYWLSFYGYGIRLGQFLFLSFSIWISIWSLFNLPRIGSIYLD